MILYTVQSDWSVPACIAFHCSHPIWDWSNGRLYMQAHGEGNFIGTSSSKLSSRPFANPPISMPFTLKSAPIANEGYRRDIARHN